MKPTASASRTGLTIEVYSNRVEVKEGMWPLAKTTTIPTRNIASVDIERGTKRLIIHTNDGKAHKYAIGGFGKSEQLRDAILSAL